jgi:hypothetical protein
MGKRSAWLVWFGSIIASSIDPRTPDTRSMISVAGSHRQYDSTDTDHILLFQGIAEHGDPIFARLVLRRQITCRPSI